MDFKGGEMNSRKVVLTWIICAVMFCVMCVALVYRIDPYFHYHYPLIDKYYYEIDDERTLNDGIIKNFDYDAIITGTSMTGNFKTSEADQIFGCTSIKAPSSGATYCEINGYVQSAIAHKDIALVIRGLDMTKYWTSANLMRWDAGTYPEYLYDDKLYNDVNYWFNKDVLLEKIVPMIVAKNKKDFMPGITPFDDHSAWGKGASYGKDGIISEKIEEVVPGEVYGISEEEWADVKANIEQNVIRVARDNPDIEFYYFTTPYSLWWWREQLTIGWVDRYLEAEKYLIEQCLNYDNIKLFSFNTRSDITGDLNNYMDYMHYAPWVNSWMLRCMKEGKYQLTKDNYEQYLSDEAKLYYNYDYLSFIEQIDYEDDNIAVERFVD